MHNLILIKLNTGFPYNSLCNGWSTWEWN